MLAPLWSLNLDIQKNLEGCCDNCGGRSPFPIVIILKDSPGRHIQEECKMIHFQNFYELIYNWPLIALLVGLATWVMGWKIYKAFIILAGALVGALVLPQFFYDNNSMVFLLLTLAGAVVGGLLAIWAMYAGIFLLGVYAGLGLSNYYLGFESYYVSLAIGAVLGILFVIFFKFAVVYITSFAGAYLIVTSSVLLLNVWLSSFWQHVVIIVLAIAGILLQYKIWGAPDKLDPSWKKQRQHQD